MENSRQEIGYKSLKSRRILAWQHFRYCIVSIFIAIAMDHPLRFHEHDHPLVIAKILLGALLDGPGVQVIQGDSKLLAVDPELFFPARPNAKP